MPPSGPIDAPSDVAELVTRAAPTPEEFARDDAVLEPQTVVGRFTVVERIGQGGMGVVYAAEDPELGRKVAIKLMRPQPGDNTSTGEARLLREARSIAQLSHPNVIHVYEVGMFRDRLFMAMEWLDGSSLRRWLKASKRGWTEIVGVFVQAGRGLAAAHAAGLVHRDFKPDNVIVDGKGRTRVLDFGLARTEGKAEPFIPSMASALLGDSTPSTDVTQAGAAVGTPAYMAPEQHLGETAGANADQYAFCVALYEALFDKRPFVGVGNADILDLKLGGPPTPTQTHGVPIRIRRAIMRGLAAKPDDRWPDMDSLLAELAIHPGRTRNRVLMGGAFVAAGAIAVWGSTRQPTAPCLERDAPLSDVWNDERGSTLTTAFEATGLPYATTAASSTATMLDEYASRWTAMYRDACEATHLRGEQSEALLDLRMACLDRRRVALQTMVGVFVEPDSEVVESAVDAASELPRVQRCGDADALRSVEPPPPSQQAQIDEIRANIDTARSLVTTRRREQAVQTLGDAVDQAKELDYAPLVAEVLVFRSKLHEGAGKLEEARTDLLDALPFAAAAGLDRVEARAWVELVFIAGYKMAKHDEALSWLKIADVAQARIPDLEPMARAHGSSIAALFHQRRGKLDQAIADGRRAVAIVEAELGPEHGVTAQSWSNLGLILDEAGQTDEGREYLLKSLASNIQTLGDQHPRVADTLLNLGKHFHRLGRYDEALRHNRRALAIYEAVYGPNHRKVAALLNNLATAMLESGAYKEGITTLKRGLQIYEAEGTHGQEVPDSLNNLAIAYLELGEYETANDHAERSVALMTQRMGEGHPRVGLVMSTLAIAQMFLDQLPVALATNERAHALLAKGLGDDHVLLAYTRTTKGEVLLKMERAKESVEALEDAVRLRAGKEVDPKHAADTHFSLARALVQLDPRKHRTRAIELATAAKAAYTEAGDTRADELAEVGQFLQAQQPGD